MIGAFSIKFHSIVHNMRKSIKSSSSSTSYITTSSTAFLLLLSLCTKFTFAFNENTMNKNHQIEAGSDFPIVSQLKSRLNQTVEVKWMNEKIGTIQCYVCSWSILPYSSNDSINIDICSTGKFIPEASSTTNCVHGCQAVGFRSSEKEGLQNFYRNCLKMDPGDEAQDRCYKTKTFYGIEEKCECLSTHCNGSNNNHHTTHAVKILISLSFNYIILLVLSKIRHNTSRIINL